MTILNLQMSRGDTPTFEFTVGAVVPPINWTNAVVWFTAKRKMSDSYSSAVIALTSADAGLTVDGPNNKIYVTLSESHTTGLTKNTTLHIDVQVKEAAGRVTTPVEPASTLTVKVDVTDTTVAPIAFIFGDRSVATRILSTDLKHIFLVGDSRTFDWERYQIPYSPLIPWGGGSAGGYNFDLDAAGAHDSTKVLRTSGDTLVASVLLPATNINAYSPTDGFETAFLGGAEPSAPNVTLNRMFSAATLFTRVRFGLPLWHKLDSATATLNAIWYEVANGLPTSLVELRFRSTGTNNTDPGYYSSAGFDVANATPQWVKRTLSIPLSQDWSTYVDPALEIGITPGASPAASTSSIIAGAPWIESSSGGSILHCWSMGGRSIDGFLGSVFPASHWTSIAPLYGTERILWIDLGTNNPAAYTVAQHKEKLLTLVNNFRAGTPNGKVLITTAYPASTDTAGVRPYYAQAAVEFAQENSNVLCLDTHLAQPTFTAGSAAFLYADATHYNDTGRASLAKKIQDLLVSAG